MSIDDTVWLENGLPGIVIGLGDGYISILWINGSVTKVKKVYLYKLKLDELKFHVIIK